MAKIKLAIVDDHKALRNALTKLLHTESGMEVVLSAEDGIDLLKKLRVTTPDIILMDIRMPKMNGIEATKEILTKYPAIKVIAHTQYDNDDNIIEMYRQGVKSFICKSGDPSELITAIRVVYNGGNYVTDAALSIFKNLLDINPTKSNHEKSLNMESLSKLSPIELNVLWHTASLKSIKQIAKELYLSPHTINNHQANIRKKLNLFGRNTLVQYAVSIRKKLEGLHSTKGERVVED